MLGESMNFKADYILSKIKGKEVLDIGSGGDLVYFGDEATDKKSLLAFKIVKTAKSLELIEIDEKAAEAFRRRGFQAHYGNAESLQIGKKFDIIVLGDVIEHVDNIGLLFENMKTHLKNDGEIIISTPNPFSLGYFLRAATFRRPRIQYDHTCFIEPDNLKEICNRHGLRFGEAFYFTDIDNRNMSLKIKSFTLMLIGKIWKYFNQSWIVALTIEDKKI